MKKLFLISFLLCCSIIGCSKPESSAELTQEEFIKEETEQMQESVQDHGLVFSDMTEFAPDETYLKIIGGREENGKYSFEYNIMTDHDAAILASEKLTTLLDDAYEGLAVKESKKEEHIYIYRVTADDYYCEVLVDNDTMLYTTSAPEYIDEINAILKEMDYRNITK